MQFKGCIIDRYTIKTRPKSSSLNRNGKTYIHDKTAVKDCSDNKATVGLKTLLLQGLSEPEFYGDLVYKFRKIIGKIDFPYHFKKIIVRYKKIGYNINVMRQTACLVVNPIKVNSFAYLFNCTTVGRTSD